MNFPQFISFTITNRCNLCCRMCGQWSRRGYMHKKGNGRTVMGLDTWKRIVDELADHGISSVLLRGGEPFLFPGIMELLEYINSRGIFISIDTNGTMLERYAADIVRIGNIHLTISVDGPEAIHDRVRGVRGCFNQIKKGALKLHELEKAAGKRISRSLCFTISRYSYKGLAELPDAARSLFIDTIVIVPYYFVPRKVGKLYEKILEREFHCSAFSWYGFRHESSGVNYAGFLQAYRQFNARLRDIRIYPYMPLTEEEYRIWFRDAVTPVGAISCRNVERLLDIQPHGEANFCVDFPDFSIGNVQTASIASLWNSEQAEAFRAYRCRQPFPVCCRCGAKYMSEPPQA